MNSLKYLNLDELCSLLSKRTKELLTAIKANSDSPTVRELMKEVEFIQKLIAIKSPPLHLNGTNNFSPSNVISRTNFSR